MNTITLKQTRTIELETLALMFIAAAVGLFFAWKNNFSPQFHVTIPLMKNTVSVQETPTISPSPVVNEVSQVSSDGTKKVVMRTTQLTGGKTAYSFSTTDGQNNNEQPLYTTTLSSSENMSIPFNTFSPDNQYLFLLKNGNDALVFKTSGEAFSDGQPYFDVTDLFAKRNTGYNFSEATGWASPTLLIINTLTQNDVKGASFWFEVPSKAIIQLSTQF